MRCKRCGNDFDRADLRPPSLILRVLAAPYFLLMLPSGALWGEIKALYCRRCRRQLNVCFLFIAFLVIALGIPLAIERLGLFGQ